MRRDPDLLLLSAMVRAAYDDGCPIPTDRLADDVVIDSALRLAARHRVEGLAWEGLVRSGYSTNSKAAIQLRDRAGQIVATQLISLALSRAILQRFSDAGLRLMFLKGLTLASLCYPRPQAKDSCDIDVLVHSRDLAYAAGLLAECGFVLCVPATLGSLDQWHRRRKESVWTHPDMGIQLDLHTRPIDNPDLAPDVGICSDIQWVDVGSGCRLPTLADPELFAYLCAHGASSAWFRLKWLADLGAFLARRSEAEIDDFYGFAADTGLGTAAGQSLILLERWFAVTVPAGLNRRLKSRRKCVWLADLADRQLTHRREPTERLGGTIAIHLTQALLGNETGYGVKEVTRQAIEIVSRSRLSG